MKKIIKEFRDFAVKGNMLDLAVGVIIGSAFSAIVNSIVNDIIMPIVGILIGGHDFSSLSVTFGTAKVNYGMLIQNVVNFLIIAACLFVFVKAINNMKKRFIAEEKKEEPVKKSNEEILLEQIRDTLCDINNK